MDAKWIYSNIDHGTIHSSGTPSTYWYGPTTTLTLQITPDSNYNYPDEITVQNSSDGQNFVTVPTSMFDPNADYDCGTGEIILHSPSGELKIIGTCVSIP